MKGALTFRILGLQIRYTGVNLGSVFWMEGKESEKLCYMTMFIKKLSCTTFGLYQRERIIVNMNFRDYHKFMFATYLCGQSASYIRGDGPKHPALGISEFGIRKG